MCDSVTLLIALLSGIAPSKAEQLPIRTYTTADGLARDRVYKIVSDPRGFLWFCTYDGLSRFDGYEFVNYSIEHGLPHRLVFDLLITRKGDYWVATNNGVARFNPLAATSNPKLRSYIPTQRPISETIFDLYEDSSGTVWAGTAELNVSVNTIKFHLRHIYDKLHVHTKSEAVAKALRHGLTR